MLYIIIALVSCYSGVKDALFLVTMEYYYHDPKVIYSIQEGKKSWKEYYPVKDSIEGLLRKKDFDIREACLYNRFDSCRVYVNDTVLDGDVLRDSLAIISFAKAVFHSTYGPDETERNNPYRLFFYGDDVYVYGTCHARFGGMPEIRIRKRDGKVIAFCCGK